MIGHRHRDRTEIYPALTLTGEQEQDPGPRRVVRAITVDRNQSITGVGARRAGR
jgi:hypothetical protein